MTKVAFWTAHKIDSAPVSKFSYAVMTMSDLETDVVAREATGKDGEVLYFQSLISARKYGQTLGGKKLNIGDFYAKQAARAEANAKARRAEYEKEKSDEFEQS